MKKVLVSVLLCCLIAPFAMTQTEAEIKEEVSKSMEQLKKDMHQLGKELKENLKDIKVDLSGLDQLKEIDWSNHPDYKEGMAYLDSDEFKAEMKKVREEVGKAMEEVRREMAEVEAFDFEEINKIIEDAMKEVEEELSNIRKKE